MACHIAPCCARVPLPAQLDPRPIAHCCPPACQEQTQGKEPAAHLMTTLFGLRARRSTSSMEIWSILLYTCDGGRQRWPLGRASCKGTGRRPQRSHTCPQLVDQRGTARRPMPSSLLHLPPSASEEGHWALGTCSLAFQDAHWCLHMGVGSATYIQARHVHPVAHDHINEFIRGAVLSEEHFRIEDL